MVAPGGTCVVARGVCMVALGGGACMVAPGGHVWFYSRGHAWFYLGGMHGLIWGACMVLFGGMHGFIQGGMHGFFSFFGYNEIRSMSGRYASYWNAFLLILSLSRPISIFVAFKTFC